MNIRTLRRNSAPTRARRANLRCPFATKWCGLFALLFLFGVTLVTPSAAQSNLPKPKPDDCPSCPEPEPYCVSCGSGYHCVHNPEGCEADSPPPQGPIEQPKEPQPQGPIEQPK
jgi:hypothetical protein